MKVVIDACVLYPTLLRDLAAKGHRDAARDGDAEELNAARAATPPPG